MQQIKDKKSYIIVVGNEKGGAGKTTSTMHLIASLLKLGFKVSSVDTDHRQASLSRYLENRHQTIEKNNLSLPTPTHYRTSSSTQNTISDIEKEEKQQLLDIIDKERDQVDFIVIDTPGSNSNLSRFAHSYADTIITPINDSFIDLDLLALVDGESLNVVKPGIYSQMVWEQKIERAKREQKAADWIVMRNRLTSVDAKNKRNMETVVGNLAKRVAFRVSTGFGERVIFRELFLKGLTLLDLLDPKLKFQFSLSHIAARHELRSFIRSLNIPQITQALEKQNL
jgi:chromosome partitioning protein